ncbi:hypothetical protein N1851_020401 [Merluccius polli]|uniref:Uncharacterized protein n=1 Tax=Merluccius polli TaxID=89951 RepID=A0AA47MKS3_MERPO|nr:hypothetical protein N1851_020401 [Merluccius polli]
MHTHYYIPKNGELRDPATKRSGEVARCSDNRRRGRQELTGQRAPSAQPLTFIGSAPNRDRPAPKDCHQFTITKLYNIQMNPKPEDIIHLDDSNCVGQTHNLFVDASAQIDSQSLTLPIGVLLACGRKIYSYVPNHAKGKCYLANTVPVIWVVTPQEIQGTLVLQREKGRGSGTHSPPLCTCLVIPRYGVYLNQQEPKALEDHINSTKRVVIAISIHLNEVTKVALQNRMALDFHLDWRHM